MDQTDMHDPAEEAANRELLENPDPPAGIQLPGDLIPANVDLEVLEGNAYAIIGAVQKALRRAGNTPEVIEAFKAEATSGNWDHLLQTAMAYTTGEVE